MNPNQQPNAVQAAQQIMGGQQRNPLAAMGGMPQGAGGGNPQVKQQLLQLLQQMMQLLQQM